ncbi:tape measure protein [Agrobacterium vitis]|uniref:tape measure protein n=1 Tax=Agrobacterium vitis TaxID=373 RepID=UPI0012E8555B|nr:tape measure protein [Agrobacterium vitis]MVA36117.1 tape measure protein [Agrobacterium vitis]
MAITEERLVAVLEARIKDYEKNLSKATKTTGREFQKIETRGKQMEARLAAIGANSGGRMAAAMKTTLGAVAGALTVAEVAKYADAWTTAKNSLSVAGVTGQKQVEVLDQLYNSAQKNAVPVNALTDLYGKMSSANDILGASSTDLMKATDGVAIALKVAGTTAPQASGALLQLGQLLGSGTVHAEEFNSIMEGARPILSAVASGLDAAGGSVSRLKQLVVDGKVSSQQFFQSFLKGLPTIAAQANNATTTIDGGFTRVNNALERYIGQTDEGLGASQRLVAGLTALANNFDETADMVLKVASIIAGALVGQAITKMIASLGLGTVALVRFVAALRAAQSLTALSGALGGVSAAAGPVGLLIGTTVVGALALFSSSSQAASIGADTYAAALERVKKNASEVAPAIEAAAKGVDFERVRSLQEGIAAGTKDIDDARAAAAAFFTQIINNAPRRLISEEQLSQLSTLRDGLQNGTTDAANIKQELNKIALVDPKFSRLADQLKPFLDRLVNAATAVANLKAEIGTLNPAISPQTVDAYKQYANSRAQGEKMVDIGKQYSAELTRQAALSKDELDVQTKIASIRKDLVSKGGFMDDASVRKLAEQQVAAEKGRSNTSGGDRKENDYASAVEQIQKHTALINAQTAAQAGLNPLVDDYGYAVEKAHAKEELLNAAKQQGLAITPSVEAQINALAEGYASAGVQAEKLAQSQDKARESAQQLRSDAKDVLSGVVSDFRSGASAADTLANAIDKIADKLINSLLDSMLQVNSAGGGHFCGGRPFSLSERKFQ